MQLSRISKTSDRLGRYYTAADVAHLLVESMGVTNPKIVIELGAGDGALVGEASRQWSKTKFITVDIDGNAKSSNLNLIRKGAFRHHTGDALDGGLSEKIGVRFGAVDSGLCNPPYVRPKWRKHFAEILEDAGLSNIIPRIGCVPADILFIAQNLRFLRAGGKLGLILPDGVIAGEKYAKLRGTLVAAHNVERVIELPRSIFHATDAKAHIVVLAKHESQQAAIQIQQLGRNGQLSEPIALTPELATARLDYSYLSSRSHQRSRPLATSLRAVTQLLRRGSFSSAERAQVDFPVFHTTDFPEENPEVPPHFLLSKKAARAATGVLSQAGDILLARVGRNLEHKACKVSRGTVVVSDCVLVLRVDPEYRERAFTFLTSKAGRAALFAASHGVGARFITTEALLCLQI